MNISNENLLSSCKDQMGTIPWHDCSIILCMYTVHICTINNKFNIYFQAKQEEEINTIQTLGHRVDE